MARLGERAPYRTHERGRGEKHWVYGSGSARGLLWEVRPYLLMAVVDRAPSPISLPGLLLALTPVRVFNAYVCCRGGAQDETGTAADDTNGPVVQAVRLLRATFPRLIVMCDVCLCAYTSHGHCGARCQTLHPCDSVVLTWSSCMTPRQACCIRTAPSTTPRASTASATSLCATPKQVPVAVSSRAQLHDHAVPASPSHPLPLSLSWFASLRPALGLRRPGAHVVAPSDMMDGRIFAIKHRLVAHGLAGKVRSPRAPGWRRVAFVCVSPPHPCAWNTASGPFVGVCHELQRQVCVLLLRPLPVRSRAAVALRRSPDRPDRCHDPCRRPRDAAKSAPAFGDRKCYQLPPGARGLARRAIVRRR